MTTQQLNAAGKNDAPDTNDDNEGDYSSQKHPFIDWVRGIARVSPAPSGGTSSAEDESQENTALEGSTAKKEGSGETTVDATAKEDPLSVIHKRLAKIFDQDFTTPNMKRYKCERISLDEFQERVEKIIEDAPTMPSYYA